LLCSSPFTIFLDESEMGFFHFPLSRGWPVSSPWPFPWLPSPSSTGGEMDPSPGIPLPLFSPPFPPVPHPQRRPNVGLTPPLLGSAILPVYNVLLRFFPLWNVSISLICDQRRIRTTLFPPSISLLIVVLLAVSVFLSFFETLFDPLFLFDAFTPPLSLRYGA